MNKWLELYNKKVPEGFKRDELIALFYSPEKGFAEIGNSGKMIIVNQTCGELKFWRGVAEKLARQCGHTHAGTILLAAGGRQNRQHRANKIWRKIFFH